MNTVEEQILGKAFSFSSFQEPFFSEFKVCLGSDILIISPNKKGDQPQQNHKPGKDFAGRAPWSQPAIISIDVGSSVSWSGPDIRFEESVGELGDDDEDNIFAQRLLSEKELSSLSSPIGCVHFRLVDNERAVADWQGVVLGPHLYVEVPPGELPPGSRDCLVSVLEYAEESLHSTHVFLCFDKSRTDRDCLLKTFMFLGFSLVRPNHPSCPSNNNYIFMVYEVE